jgi:tetratricopeptide (TPR) repeat protein
LEESEIILKRAKVALEQNRLDEAMTILNETTIANNGKAIFLKGEIFFKLQRWGEALNQFSLFLDQYPSDQKAESYCAMIQNILGFYHKDLYNP